MPTTNGVYTPISMTQAAGMYQQAIQIIRGQLGAVHFGKPGQGDDYILGQMTDKYLRGTEIQPADRGRMGQILAQAHTAHDNAIALNQPGAGKGTLAGLNIDPTIEAGGPRVRYRVVVQATDGSGRRSEILVRVDADGVLTPDDIAARAIMAAAVVDPMRTRGYNIEDFATQGLHYETFVIGAGKSR